MRMKKLALLLSLLALGALGLVACGGGGDDQTTAASASETTDDALAADSKSCGAYERWRLAVVRGMSCREARRVIHDYVYQRPTPVGLICYGGDQPVECRSEAGETIRAPVRNAVLRRWDAAEAS
jgi:hypothetical protein